MIRCSSAASAVSMPASSTMPASKSIQPGLRVARSWFDAILTVGTGKPSGVPRPVVNRIAVAPAAASAVDDTASLPGASSSVRPRAAIIFSAQSFLTTEAPVINNYMSRVLGSAEGFQLYSSISAFTTSATPVMADAPVLVLKFKEPGGNFRYSVMSFEDPGSGLGKGLYFRHITAAGVLGTPEWALTKQAADVKFSITEGILRAKITGPNAEEITYSGTQQL